MKKQKAKLSNSDAEKKSQKIFNDTADHVSDYILSLPQDDGESLSGAACALSILDPMVVLRSAVYALQQGDAPGVDMQRVHIISQLADMVDQQYDPYMDMDKKIDIICPKHGTSQQTPNDHLAGAGFPQCDQYEARGKKAVRQ